jgi:hypothetical protein
MDDELRGRLNTSDRTVDATDSARRPTTTKDRGKSKKINIALPRYLVITLVLIVIGTAGYFAWQRTKTAGPIPKKVTKNLDFPLYYPFDLPAGYSVNESSFIRRENVLIFSIETRSGKSIAVSEEAVPATAPIRSTNSSPIPIPGEKAFSSSIGQVHIGL